MAPHHETTNRQTQGDDCPTKYTDANDEYIKSHLNDLLAKCEHENNCIYTLWDGQTVASVLEGNAISVNQTCSLVYNSGNETLGNISGKCTHQGRKDLRDDIEQNLEHQLTQGRNSGLSNVKNCLDKSYGDLERSYYVDDICRLAHKSRPVCNNSNVHANLKELFNDIIHHVRCSCKFLQVKEPITSEPSSNSMPFIIGGAVGGVVFLLALFLIGFICYRRRRRISQQKRNRQVPNVIYVQAPNSDNCPVYQEIFDDRAYQSYKQTTTANPPTLPVRYTTTKEDDHGYIDAVEISSQLKPRLPVPGNSNPTNGSPPEYRERDPSDEHDIENVYFEPIPNPVEENDKGYDTLGRSKSDHEKIAPIDKITETELPNVSKSEGATFIPVPAKRTKKDDYRAESPYFVLEDGRRENSSN